jgi:hypothetical protein
VCILLLTTVDDVDLWMYSGGFLLIAVATAAVIAAAIDPGGGPVPRVLSLWPLPAIGLISYGLYLWHWPVYLVLTSGRLGISGPPLVLIRLAATFVVSLASYHLVEMPVRRGALRGKRPVWLAAATAAVTAVALVVVGTVAGPSGSGTPASAALLAPPDPDATRVLLVGDSSAFTFTYAFPREELRHRITLDSVGVLGCGIVLGQTDLGGSPLTEDRRCATVFDSWRRKVDAFDPQVSLAMLGSWEVLDRKVDGRLLRVGTDAYRRYLMDRLDQGIDILTHGGRTPLALLGVPCFGRSSSAVDPRMDDARSDEERTSWTDGVFRDAARAHPGAVTYIDFGGYLCPNGKDLVERDGVRIREDGVHFTIDGGAVVWRWLAPQLEAIAERGASGA